MTPAVSLLGEPVAVAPETGEAKVSESSGGSVIYMYRGASEKKNVLRQQEDHVVEVAACR